MLGFWITDEPLFRDGFIILAATPPAIAIIPFSYNMKADVNYSTTATILGFLAALVIMPVSAAIFLRSRLGIFHLLITLIELIVLPIMVAQLMRLTKLITHTEKYHGTIINWCLFIVTFSAVGLNRDIILSAPQALWPAAIAGVVSTFVLGEIILIYSRLNKVNRPLSMTYALLGTMKNWAGASAIAISLLGKEAAVPSTVILIFGILYYVWLSVRFNT